MTRWTRRRLIADFLRGLSMVGLARKWGLTLKRVEKELRAGLGK